MPPNRFLAAVVALVALAAGAPVQADPYDYGTTLIPSAINREHGEMRFAFTHRFQVRTFPSGATPTIHFEYGITDALQIHSYFATQQRPGDFEAGLRYQFLNENNDDWLSLSVRGAYASLGKSGIGEITISKNHLTEWLGMGLVYRAFSNGNNFGNFVHAAGLGIIAEVSPGLNLYGDVVAPFDKTIIDRFGISWTSGLQWWIPDSPHVAMLFVGVTGAGTTQGRTFSPGKDFGQQFRIGFEFSTLLDVVTKKRKKDEDE